MDGKRDLKYNENDGYSFRQNYQPTNQQDVVMNVTGDSVQLKLIIKN